MKRRGSGGGDAKKSRVLVFGEDANDRQAIEHLVAALVPGCPPVQFMRRPLVLVRGRAQAAVHKTAADLVAAVKAAAVNVEVRLVVAHEDCDALEPAHEALANRIEGAFGGIRAPVVAATPAWEIEAWWYQWPDAVRRVNRQWRDPNRAGSDIGRLEHAKEQLRRDLRPHGAHTRDYAEADSVEIAKNVREAGCIDDRRVRSASFDRFATRVREALAR
ncbi:MAG: hypothetical protein H6698_07160 [Myxococcales bacterium]|nr:hypothetical protein [Myxococcales bacterium]MCB9521535.1 hypothetical protein [Myxococcales bacterium]MCB9534086.1 hypothetical protein [Myxococcales bacterium]